jgi:hypothetical protein
MTEQNQTQSVPTNAEHPEIAEVDWIDDVFRVEQKKWGTWESFDKNGKGIVTGMTKEVVIHMTRFYLKGEQDGWSGNDSRVVNDGVVGGKL